jgi:serine phosphatase RsbU (regulator of sigma subunit)/ligand-binding sensor protein
MDKNADIQLTKLIRETRLGDLVDVDVLQRVQDGFAETTGISVVVRDLQGQRVTRPSCQNAFCKLVNTTDAGEKCCRESNKRAVLRAAKEHRVVKYVCHAGLTQYAAPIEVNGICVGTIVMGDRPEGSLDPKRMGALAKKAGIPSKDLQKALGDVARWSEGEMSRAISLLLSIANSVAGLCYQGAELREKLREISALYEVSRTLAGTLELSKLLKLVARSATQIAGAKGCSIRLLDSGGKTLVIKSFYNLSQRYLDKGPVLVARSSIDQKSLAGEVVQIHDMLHDPRVLYPKEAEKEGIRSGVSLGLISKEKPIGTLHLYSAEPRRFDKYEVQLLRSLANQAAVAIENAQLFEQYRQKRRLDRELQLAGRIQERLLPEKPPIIKGYDIASYSRPCREVGGDFFDFISLREKGTVFVIADVAGKGVPGALLMASARAALRAHLESTQEPRELMRRLNRNICNDTQTGQFVTLFCGVLDAKRNAFTYANAGHNPPLLVRKGRVEPLEIGGMVLGADDSETYDHAEVLLKRGDLLYFYTDGVTEAMDRANEMFGMKRLEQVLKEPHDGGADALVGRIAKAVREFTKRSAQSDDITMIALRVE